MGSLTLYNSLTRKKEIFEPIDCQCVKMYACGPTVYNHIHIGNARSAVFADMVFRVLSKIFPKVIYARNITDVDDKIVNAALERGISAQALSLEYADAFKKITSSLFCLPPTFEPKATEHIEEMSNIIEKLISKDYAYVVDGDVYFDVSKYREYGALSGFDANNKISGYRIDLKFNKRNEEDFALWKKVDDDKADAVWKTKWSIGRPGWHIECSAMAHRYLGENFDIHCGGEDLKFPHHENEIAQSCCAFDNSFFAKIWLHNGLLKVENSKMSKSLGNFILAKDFITSNKAGEILRYIFLCSHYRSSLNWTADSFTSAKSAIDRFYDLFFKNFDTVKKIKEEVRDSDDLDQDFFSTILDDINTPIALAKMHDMVTEANTLQGNDSKKENLIKKIFLCGKFLGIFNYNSYEWFNEDNDAKEIEDLIIKRNAARNNKDYELSDRIRDKLKAKGVEIFDHADGNTKWRFNR